MTDGESAIPTNFERLFGRASTGAEREQLLHVQKALGLRDNDALWLVLFALQYYEGLYRQFPKAIGAEATRILGETRAASEATVRASAESAKADLAKAVAMVARDVAHDAARRQMLQWLVVGMTLGALIFGLGFSLGVNFGRG
jgi:hypothetical protein